MRKPANFLMLPVVQLQVSPLDSRCQRDRLAERYREALSRDGIRRSGSVPNQGDRLIGNSTEFPIGRDTAAKARHRRNPLKFFCDGRKCFQKIALCQLGISSDEHDTNTICGDRSDVDLSGRSPMHLHVFTPWCNVVVAAKTEADA